MKYVRKRSKCKECPLRDRTRVWGVGPARCKIAIYGEAPGADEDRSGAPFVGRAGKYLDWALAEAGILRSQCFISNAISCRPPNNQFDSFEGIDAQGFCRQGFEDELAHLRNAGVKVIIPLGNNAKEYFGIEGGITKIRGSVYEKHGFYLLPTWHPSYLQRMRYTKQNTKVDLKYVWLADLKKAKEIASSDWEPAKERFIIEPTLEDIDEFLEAARANNESLALDIETTGLNPEYADVVCIGLARNSSDAICIPFLKKGGASYWNGIYEQRVIDKLNSAFSEFKFLVQNALFDINFLRRKGYEINYECVSHDTLILHHAIAPELPHKLGFIVSTYGDTPYWKDEFLKREVSILQLPNKTLREYNCRDCVVLHQVLDEMLEDLEESGNSEIYYNESLPLLKPVGRMIENGFRLDRKKLNSLKKRFEESQREKEALLRTSGKLPPEFNLNSDDDLRYFLFGIEPRKFKNLEDLAEYSDRTKTGKRVRSKDTKAWKKLQALEAIREKTRPIFTLPGFRGRRTKSGTNISVNEKGRLSLRIALQNRLARIERFSRRPAKVEREYKAINKLLNWLRLFDDYQKATTLLERYLDFPTGKDGRVHTSFILHGPPTGRLASSSPNLQNIPKRGEGIIIREAFVASKGNTLISADYSNLEVRVLAYESNDRVLIKQLESGMNIHDENTKVLFGIDKRHSNWSAARRAAKVFQFGRLSYGGGDMEVYANVVTEAPEMKLTMRQFKEATSRYFAAHPDYVKWASELNDSPSRFTTTFMGRTRELFGGSNDRRKQKLNHPIQGGAAHIINRAMIRIDKRMGELGLKSKLICQVHDQLIFDTVPKERDVIIKLAREEMERSVDFRGREVKFPVDVEEGPNWGKLKEIK